MNDSIDVDADGPASPAPLLPPPRLPEEGPEGKTRPGIPPAGILMTVEKGWDEDDDEDAWGA